jgi:hypothetical protein
MAWEWVAPVATAASGIIGAAVGAGFTYRAGQKGREHVESMADKTSTSQLALAREARRAEVYSQVFKLVARESVLFLHEGDESRFPLRLSDPHEWTEEILTCTTQVGLYGSREVQEIYSRWSKHLTVLHRNNLRRTVSRENASPNHLADEAELDEAREALGKANGELREQMNRELTS